jgi:hypothetical protein
MVQNLKGPHPLKSDYSGEIVGFHNDHSYAVKIQPVGRVSVRNRATLHKIPKPAPVHLPVLEPVGAGSRNVDSAVTRVTRSMAQGDRLSGNGHVGSVLTPADGRVNRSRGSDDMESRQETLVTGFQGPKSAMPAGIPGQSDGSGQALMKQAPGQSDQAYGEAIFENLFNQVRPGVLRGSHVSGQRSLLNDDSGPSKEQSRGVQPVQAASQGGQPARVGPAQDKSVRSASRESTGVDNLAVQVLGRDQLVGTSQDLAGAGPGGSEEVSSTVIRRSGRHRTKLIPYQAGSLGME